MIPAIFYPLPLMILVGVAGWLYASRIHNVNIVDTLWSLFFLLAATVYLFQAPAQTAPVVMLYTMVLLWSVRLSLHLGLRNGGKSEDRRYAAMRAANPHFNRQSLFTVFGLQAVLAWLLSMPLAAAMLMAVDWTVWHTAALILFALGFVFESLADWQLMRFKSNPDNSSKVLDTGLWRYSRHPNYFGEAVICWSFYLFALASDAAWTVFAPILMTLLLLKVSGVTLLEKDMDQRRPAYRDYIERTPVFVPWFPSSRQAHPSEKGGVV